MKVTKIRILIILIVLVSVSCSTNKSGSLYGNWGISTISYRGRDISGINHDSNVIFAINMSINRGGSVKLPVADSNGYGYFRIHKQGDRQYMKIFDSSDARFNGSYEIKITELEAIERTVHYSLQLRSEEMLIIGEKWVAKI